MPSMDTHHSAAAVKLLVVGDSGVGKTGGLASLVDAGYNLRILDFEDKLAPIRGYVKDKSKLANVQYHTLKDEYKIVGSSVSISKAPSFQRAMSLLNKWDDLGPIADWKDPKDVLAIDGLSSMSRASLNMVLQMNGHIGKPPELQHWGTAMDNIEKLLGNITNSNLVPCHLVMLTHITNQESEGGGLVRAYPEALGSKLNPKVARYFDNMVSLSLTAGERSYKLKKDGLIACKTSKPMDVDKLPLETGLADLFKRLLG